MNFKLKSFLVLLIFGFCAVVSAQSVYRPVIYKAYLQGDMKKWEQVILQMEKAGVNTIDEKLELVSYYYGYIGYLLGIKKYEPAARYADKGDKLITSVIKQSPKNATAYAFRGSFIGFRIGMSRFKAITLGPESNKNIVRALELDPANIQAIADNANSLYHTPRLFGGNKEESLKLFQKAAQLIEKNKHTDQNWFYLNVLTLTAKNYESLGELAKAKLMYEKVLRHSPEFKWVKNELLPALNSRITS